MKNFFTRNRIIILVTSIVLIIGILIGGYFIYQGLDNESVVATEEDDTTKKKSTTESNSDSEDSSEDVTKEENPEPFPDYSHLLRHAPNMYINWCHEETEYDAVTIDWKCTEDAWGTYWAVHNWTNGYAGFQNILNSHVLIFSLWDLEDGTRPTVEFSLSDTYGDFGGEGEGKKVYTEYDWKVNTWYSMKIDRVYENGKTYFSQYIKEEDGEWLKTATISYPVKHDLSITYVFQEDFLFNNTRRSCEVKNAGGLVAGTKKWVDWNECYISNSFFPTAEATWESGVMENVSFNCDYEFDGKSIWIQSGGYDDTPNNKSYPITLTIQ